MAIKVFTTTPGAQPHNNDSNRLTQFQRLAASLTNPQAKQLAENAKSIEDLQNAFRAEWTVNPQGAERGPLANWLMRVSFARNRDSSITHYNGIPITNAMAGSSDAAREARSVHKSVYRKDQPVATPFVMKARMEQERQKRLDHQPAVAQAAPTTPVSTIAPQSPDPTPTTLDNAQPGTQVAAGTSGSSGQTVATPFVDLKERAQNQTTQFRSQRSGFSGNRRYHPFAGGGS